MDTFELFSIIKNNLKVSNVENIRRRRDEITKALNREFRDSDSESDNRLMVGSWGRHTAIDGVSDLDMLYELPAECSEIYRKAGGTSKVLTRVKEGILKHYSRSKVTVDQLVVVVEFTDFKFEIQPVFKNDDGSFSFPDTYSDTWKITKPRLEIEAMKDIDERSSGVGRSLCRLTRAWRRKHEIKLNGLLIDTFVWKFLQTSQSQSGNTNRLDYQIRDFFKYLSELPKQESWNALGSNQRVYVKALFQHEALKAYHLCCKAIEAKKESDLTDKWRAVFGRFVPIRSVSNTVLLSNIQYENTEEYIEDHYAINIQHQLVIDCEVTQKGFRPSSLREMIVSNHYIQRQKDLLFRIVQTDVPKPYEVKWKIKNEGSEAIRRNMIRGQIVDCTVACTRKEHSDFNGDHYVECYIIKNSVVVARDRIRVPIGRSSW